MKFAGTDRTDFLILPWGPVLVNSTGVVQPDSRLHPITSTGSAKAARFC